MGGHLRRGSRGTRCRVIGRHMRRSARWRIRILRRAVGRCECWIRARLVRALMRRPVRRRECWVCARLVRRCLCQTRRRSIRRNYRLKSRRRRPMGRRFLRRRCCRLVGGQVGRRLRRNVCWRVGASRRPERRRVCHLRRWCIGWGCRWFGARLVRRSACWTK